MSVLCAKCLLAITPQTRQCPTCGFTISDDYYDKAREAPLLPIALIGHSRVGKSHLHRALVLTIKNLANHIDDAENFVMAQTELNNLVDEAFEHAARGTCLDRTPRGDGEIAGADARVWVLHGALPATNESRTIVLYDVAGEAMQRPSDILQELPALAHCEQVWFVVEPDQADTPRPDPNRLFETYRSVMAAAQVPMRGVSALVVLAKADLLTDDELGGPILHYLHRDPISPTDASGNRRRNTVDSFSTGDYAADLRAMSKEMEKVIKAQVENAGTLITNLRHSGMNVGLCVTSALGQKTDHNNNLPYPARWGRRRVLDPLVWSMTDTAFQRRVLFVLDNSTAEAAQQALEMALEQRKLLMKDYPIAFVWSGLRWAGVPYTPADPPPATIHDRRSINVIQPILERPGAGYFQAVVLFTSTAPLDLFDIELPKAPPLIVVTRDLRRLPAAPDFRSIQFADTSRAATVAQEIRAKVGKAIIDDTPPVEQPQ